MAASFQGDRIATAVITGHHSFDVPGFYGLFRSTPGVDFYMQSLDDWAADEGQVRGKYEVLVFYNFHQETPTGEGEWWEGNQKEALEALGETGQGILVLHHGLLAYREWPLWSDLCGIQERGFGYHPDQTVRVEVADAGHPITEGLSAWEIVDETYTMDDAGKDSRILLTTVHPKSMRTLAWVRAFGKARVFCLSLGHDNRAYADPNFRTVVGRGIRWLAGRI